MSLVLFRRPPRLPGPPPPAGGMELQEPPALPEQQANLSAFLTYLPMGLASAATVLIFIHPGGGGGTFMYLAAGLMLVSTLAMLVGQLARGAGDRKRRLAGERRDYLRYLAQMRRRVRSAIAAQRAARQWRHPDPDALWTLVGGPRLWERRPEDEDFGEIRIATGEQPLDVDLEPPSTKPVEDLEPLCAHALRSFLRAYSHVPDQPVAAYLPGYPVVRLTGDREVAADLARAMVAQLAVLHAPDDLRLVFCVSDARRGAWEWAKWLPHALHPTEQDAAGPVRLFTDAAAELESLIGGEFPERPPFDPDASPDRDEPYTVVVLDGGNVPPGGRLGAAGYRNTTVLDVGGTLEPRGEWDALHLDVDADEVRVLGEQDADAGVGVDVGAGADGAGGADADGSEAAGVLGRPDRLGPAAARALAVRLAPYRINLNAEVSDPLTTDFDLTSLLGVGDLAVHDIGALWAGRGPAERLRVPIGYGADGRPVELDIKESALGGSGPHGMLIGATGSGKSELLRTLVLTLALTHSSETLNLVLVDFKGGATFLGLDTLPHTSAVITNLADETALVARMQDALHGELIRRQELLRAAGNYVNIHEYEAARAAGTALRPLPTLFVVVDEFSELLAAHREFMDLFVMIGRLGRSLGVHLLLASQRLDEGRMHQLETHLSYRIGLRTFSAMESRGVLGVPDAYQLPPAPGNGYLRGDTATLTRFKAAYVSGPYRPRRRAGAMAAGAGEVTAYGTRYLAPRTPLPAVPEPERDESAPSLLELAVDRLRDAGPPAHRVWLPPLAEPPTLDLLLPSSVVNGRGLSATGQPPLTVPVGIVDRPFDQRRDALVADLSGAGGHAGVAGGPRSGKSTMLRTLVTGLALVHTPVEAQFYCLDFGGGGLSALAGLPHVGGVAGRLDAERVARTVGEVTGVLARRERLFAARGVDSMADFRRRRAAGEFPDEPHGDVFLVVDGWSTFRQDFQDLSMSVAQLAQRALGYGVHLVVASPRWNEITPALRDQIGTRIELRLGDPMDSLIEMRKAREVPRVPGRGLTEDGLHFLGALPRVDGSGDASDVAAGLAALVAAIADAWDGPSAPRVRMLPDELPVAALPEPEGALRVPLGVEERELEPFWHDFSATPHLMVVGDAESGKTNLMRLVARAITSRYSPAEARVMTMDFRRELYEAVPEEYRLGYAVSADVARQMARAAADAIGKRMPGPEITPDRLRSRDWWEGPELFLLVDDYDLMTSPMGGSPFEPLLDMLAQGAEVGLHVIVARAANGVGRAMNEPLLRRLTELNTPAVLLSCPTAEGVLFGNVKPRQFPPGRGLWLSRRTQTQVQTALLD
ncbi:type VII secretion protein EccCa [Actinomadura rupiterrae]|uniref:type VII secretion protein EccCa n=1 Tax=Actinomadura rupiterrae TaxID=559627 RepID=UPI0020A27D10|nr:type VII secretion protein EccCa [Actinomadura rupiterrae]MCP2336732.1 S-DNA-T family DNA segregation ATPase FtsK/SpoIIIE [Actinomadura rupiterrae]